MRRLHSHNPTRTLFFFASICIAALITGCGNFNAFMADNACDIFNCDTLFFIDDVFPQDHDDGADDDHADDADEPDGDQMDMDDGDADEPDDDDDEHADADDDEHADDDEQADE